jgi:Tol biopolymer transport system component
VARTDLDKPDASVDIYVLRADGSHRTRVTKGPRLDVGPTWSPSGKRIAFAGSVSHTLPGGFQLFTIKVDGSGLTRLTHNAIMDFSLMWSPFAKRIAYSGTVGKAQELFTSGPTSPVSGRSPTAAPMLRGPPRTLAVSEHLFYLGLQTT